MMNIKENEHLNKLNHSCAHLLAHAVKRLYPEALFWVGPVIEDGFYYDIDLGDVTITEESLPLIEKEMKKIAKDGKRIYREVLSKAEALASFAGDKYKLDLINQMDEATEITCYTQDDFTDLCRGPHVETVKELKYFKLLKTSGAYWKGDANNQMLQRIYGICFDTEEALDEYLNLLEEAKKRDHRKLGKELDLFMISEHAPGAPFWLPKGLTLRKVLENYWLDIHQKAGYQFIQTPIMLSRDLWEISGHWNNYRENMYTSMIDDKEYAIKPMNCPGGILVYKNKLHSYRDFPLRLAELGLVHRHEASGALSGLFRVRNFTQDDAHIYITPDQIESEVVNVIKLLDSIYKSFNLSYHIELSTRPEKAIGEPAVWDKAEAALFKAAETAGTKVKLNPGDGAFYGPKLDFHLQDSLGRTWQCGTIQLDLNLPERFDMTYINELGEKVRPVMIHRTALGSIERFLGILIEHYAGAFPTWLAPVQVMIIPVNNEHHLDYAKSVADQLSNHNVRFEIDFREEKLGYKIRESQTNKYPYTLVVGDNDLATASVTYRKYGEQDSKMISLDEFVVLINNEIYHKGGK